ncbi:MAG: methyltransferase domain-containing protein [Bacteroidota bacterium]
MNEAFNYNSDYFEGISGTWTKLSYPFISKNLIQNIRGKKVNRSLDLGCGYGVYAEVLLDHSAEVYGLDISEDACNVCREKGYSKVFNANVDAIPINDGTIDFVFTTEVLEHILDYDKMLSEIHRMLSKDGTLVLTTTCYSTSIFVAINDPQFRLRNYLDYFGGFFSKKTRDNFVRKFCFTFLGGHYHGFLPGKLTKKITDMGFTVAEKKLFTVHELLFYKDGKNLFKKVFLKETGWPLHKRVLAFPASVFFMTANFLVNHVFAFKNNILIVAKKA